MGGEVDDIRRERGVCPTGSLTFSSFVERKRWTRCGGDQIRTFTRKDRVGSLRKERQVTDVTN